MKKYKYFRNIKDFVEFTNEPCQFCGSTEDCLEGIYFDNPEISTVCLKCFEQEKAKVIISDYLRNKIKSDMTIKVKELEYTPPVPWIQYNDWQVCCDDFCQFIGEWRRSDFETAAESENPIEFFKSILCTQTLSLVDDINVLWEDLGKGTAAFVFRCIKCDKKIVVCQSY